MRLDQNRITNDELKFLNGSGPRPASMSDAECLAVDFARAISQTPVVIPRELADQLRDHFSERELVKLSFASAQVNFFSRLFESWVVREQSND